LNTLIILN